MSRNVTDYEHKIMNFVGIVCSRGGDKTGRIDVTGWTCEYDEFSPPGGDPVTADEVWLKCDVLFVKVLNACFTSKHSD